MKRLIHPVLTLVLIAALAVLSAASGSVRAAHALSVIGSHTLVICGANGQEETITLNRDGVPIETPAGTCDHCADCSLLPVASHFSMTPILRPQQPVRSTLSRHPDVPVVVQVIEPSSHDPPSLKVI